MIDNFTSLKEGYKANKFIMLQLFINGRMEFAQNCLNEIDKIPTLEKLKQASNKLHATYQQVKNIASEILRFYRTDLNRTLNNSGGKILAEIFEKTSPIGAIAFQEIEKILELPIHWERRLDFSEQDVLKIIDQFYPNDELPEENEEIRLAKIFAPFLKQEEFPEDYNHNNLNIELMLNILNCEFDNLNYFITENPKIFLQAQTKKSHYGSLYLLLFTLRAYTEVSLGTIFDVATFLSKFNQLLAVSNKILQLFSDIDYPCFDHREVSLIDSLQKLFDKYKKNKPFRNLVDYRTMKEINKKLINLRFLIKENLEKYAIADSIVKLNRDLKGSIDGARTILQYAENSQRAYNSFKNLKLIECLPENEPVVVLSIGCGYGYELVGLQQYLNENNRTLQYLGIDISNDSVQFSQNLFKNFDGVNFAQVDATKLERVAEIFKKNSASLILLAHPDFVNDHSKSAFKQIVEKTVPNFLKKENSIVWTSFYHLNEVELFSSNDRDKLYFLENQLFVQEGDSAFSNHDIVPFHYSSTYRIDFKYYYQKNNKNSENFFAKDDSPFHSSKQPPEESFKEELIIKPSLQ